MPEPADQGSPYEVHGSKEIANALRRIQRQAAREGRGEAVLAAFRQIAQQLQMDPNQVGEPRYRLPALRMQVRCVAVRPLVVDFGVCEDKPLVFIRSVKLLAKPAS